MRVPEPPPVLSEVLGELTDPERLLVFGPQVGKLGRDERYLHWDDLRRHPAPEGVTHRAWWLAIKLARLPALRPIGLKDKVGQPFKFAVPGSTIEGLHQIDTGAGGLVSVAAPITNPQTRDQYIVSSLMEEAITSSQLEGAVTTREVAKEMIRTGRKPRDTSEQMILNNYATMQRIRELRSAPLTPELVFQIHAMVTKETLEDPKAAGCFRDPSLGLAVMDNEGQVFHEPPAAAELPERMKAMCAFANGESPDYFVHPAVRAIILHFWLAYDHPFVDGNGRTARALFYWAMLRNGYWLFEFISISSILRKAPSEYGRSFLHTETDDNDLTYFLIAQMKAIRRAIIQLHAYIARKTKELHDVESRIRSLSLFNHRQMQLLLNALKHPGRQYTFESHKKSHGVVYQTARADILELEDKNLLEKRKTGNRFVFIAPNDLADRMLQLEKESEM